MSVDTFRNGEYFSSWSAFELKARMNQLAIPWANGTACPSGPPPKIPCESIWRQPLASTIQASLRPIRRTAAV